MTVHRFYPLARCLLAVVMLWMVTACTSAGPATTLDIQMTDFSYSPAALTIPAGKEITLNLKNNGKVTHEFVIIKLGQAVTPPFGDDDEDKVYWEPEAEPGQAVSVKFTAPVAAGTYTVVCGQPEHMEAGMTGTLAVVQ